MSVFKKPDLSDPRLRIKLAKGMGHNTYGEPAWPNDLLYVFPICILGTISCCIGLAILEPALIGEKTDPFVTPMEILPEWYLYPSFNLIRLLPSKVMGIFSLLVVPISLFILPFFENINKFQNPFRRPFAFCVFLYGTFINIWLGIGALMPINKALTLGLW